MVTGKRLNVTISGGAPWGFRLQGGGNFPLEVAKIRKNSHACSAGLVEGDIVLSINGYPTSGRSHQSAMEIVDRADDRLTMEIARTGQGPSKPLDPQRQPRITNTMFSSTESDGPGIVTSAHSDYTTTSGDIRTNVHQDKYVIKIGDGKHTKKTVTEQTVTQVGGGPGFRRTSLGSVEHVSRSASRSPLVWQPPSQTGDAASQSSGRSPLMWRASSQASVDLGTRSANRSPIMWQSTGKLQAEQLPKSQSLLDVHFGHKSRATPSTRSLSPAVSKPRSPVRRVRDIKENIDPIIAAEQAKWEKLHKDDNTPKYSFSAYETSKLGVKSYAPPKMDDPNYPMFEVPKNEWAPPKIVEPFSSPKKWAPPVPPKPLSPSPDAFALNEIAGVEKHYPGMIRPPAQDNVAPAPIPPPMPPLPLDTSATFNVVPYDVMKVNTYDGGRPDHLPVFAPRVMFSPNDDSGMLMSPDGHDEILALHKKKIFSDSAFYDDSTNRYPTIDEQMSMCKKIAQSLTSFANQRARGARMFAKRKRKSDKWVHEQNRRLDLGGSEYSSSHGDIADIDELDSELYHEQGGTRPLFSFRIPRVAGQVSDGQKMSLSKAEFEQMRLVAPKVDHHGVSPSQCFTIAADLHKGGRNKGAKLFAKRQQRVEKFVIDETNVMKSPVSPSTKLDYIVQQPPVMPVQKNPWSAAAQGDVNRAFTNMPPQMSMQVPKHNLAADYQPKLLEGRNFNQKARGWGGSGPGQQQQSFYRETANVTLGRGVEATDGIAFDPNDLPKQLDTFGNYNNKIKAWPEQDVPEEKPMEFGDYNRRIKAWTESQPEPPKPPVVYNDYNRKVKGWNELSPRQHQQQFQQQLIQQHQRQQQQYYNQHHPHSQPISVTTEDVTTRQANAYPGHTVTTVKTRHQVTSVPKSYYSLPRGFGSSKEFKQKLAMHNEL